MSTPSKRDLLAHYAERDPKRWIQYDLAEPDDFTELGIWRSETYELMRGAGAVRVLVDPDVPTAVVAERLRMLADLLAADAGRLRLRLVPLEEP